MGRDRGLTVFKTALGWAGVAASERGICGVVLPKRERREVRQELESYLKARERRGRSAPSQFPHSNGGQTSAKGTGAGLERTLQKAATLLRKYFSGKSVLFDLPLDMGYYTQFQRAVWRATAGIPFGETRSYAWVAKRINNPRAARAVGRALGANPFPVIIPCHRVVDSSGGLCGFSGGLAMKKRLLELEKTKSFATEEAESPVRSRRLPRSPR